MRFPELCRRCLLYDADYDSFVQNYDDVIIDGAPERTNHYCFHYDDGIPQGKTCRFFIEKGGKPKNPEECQRAVGSLIANLSDAFRMKPG